MNRKFATDLTTTITELSRRIRRLEATPVARAVFTYTWTVSGALSISDNPFKFYNLTGLDRTISSVFLAVDTAPTGASIIVDIHKNGNTIFSTQANRPKILASTLSGTSGTVNSQTWQDQSYLTMHIDQVGSGVAGSDLTVHIVYW